MRDLVAHYHGEAEARVKRQVLTADSVTQDARGLRQLIKAGCFRAAVNLTGKLLRMYNQGVGQNQQGGGGGGGPTKHTPSSLQVSFGICTNIQYALLGGYSGNQDATREGPT